MIVTPCLIGRVFFCVYELVILSEVNFSFSTTSFIENKKTNWEGGTGALDFAADPCHTTVMNKTTSNPYAQQVLAQGRDLSNAPVPKREFPCTIGARTFETEAEYQEALAEFLNGY